MSEPILERLSRFTPDSGRLDRDALLFAAGHRSARPNRGWMTLASLLAGTQALSLAGLLWPRPSPPPADLIGPSPACPPNPWPSIPRVPRRRRIPACGRPARPLTESETEAHPASDMTFIDSEPPLRAFPPLRSLLN